ncbi:hypothetical protein [Kitasatospora aureofaciens]|uniref:hypothetical protein n=1 Tax=Kitasatospora aureofaciens TaxID=1894 RepID=UPI0036F4656B
MFVTGDFPRRRWATLFVGLLGGLLLAYAWNPTLVDDDIGFSTANALLGHDAHGTPITGTVAGVLFSFVSGLAGTFTACNIAAFSAIGPLVGRAPSQSSRLLRTVKPLGWICAGLVPVSAAYGALVGAAGTHMPQFATAAGTGLSPRSIQSMVTFGLVGLVMIVLGLAAAGIVRDPLAGVSRRFPNAPLVLVGSMIGGFLVGRPYPLFRDLFRHAATSHDPLYGAGVFVLQSVGNIAVMAVLFVLFSYLAGGRFQRWLAAKPARAAVLTAVAFLIAGVFTCVYWDVRLLARVGYLWFPPSPWS